MKNLLMVCALVLVSTVANAGMFLEPNLSYVTGETKVTVAGISGSEKVKGTALGLRAGYQMVIPWVALDVKMFKGKDDGDPSDDISNTDIGITVGASVPFLRPFIGYIPSAKIKSEGGGVSSEIEGTGLKLGLGIKLLPLIDINIEQTTYDIKKIDGQDLGAGVDVDYKTTSIGIGMTF